MPLHRIDSFAYGDHQLDTHAWKIASEKETLQFRCEAMFLQEAFERNQKYDVKDLLELAGKLCDRAVAEGKKKAKTVAKRKRAKERKKAKKTLEKEEAETIRLRKAKEAQRAASTLKCGACGTGILKPSLAFERFDQLFCTPKCARTAVKLGTG